MKLSKLLKAIATVNSAVNDLRNAGVKIPKKLDKSLATANLIAEEAKALSGSSSKAASNRSGL